jgi:hypothetical protein
MKYVIVERRVGAFENKYKAVKEGVLDDNGYANFDLRMHFNRTYDLGIQEPDNTCYTEVSIKYPLKDGQDNNITFNYAPCGYVNICFKNINCEGTNDKMQYKYYYTADPDVYLYRGFGKLDSWNNLIFVEGCIDTCGSFFEVPSGDFTFEWRVIRPSVTTTGTDYFTVTEVDTTTYLLEY